MSDRLTPELEKAIRNGAAEAPKFAHDLGVDDLLREIDALRADLTASQAPVAAAFQLAYLDWEREHEPMPPLPALPTPESVRSKR